MSAPALFKYQQEAVEYIHAAGGSLLLADETGVGKTATAVTYCADNRLRTLVVCPASLKRQWQRECQRFAPGCTAIILGEDSIPPIGEGFVITNYDQLGKWVDWLEDFDAVILDEAHLIKTYVPGKNGKKHKDSSLRAHLVHTLLGDIPHKLLLTGTAIKSRPGELWSLLHFLDPYRWPDPWKYGYKMGYVTEREVYIPGGKGKTKKVKALDGVGDTRKINADIQDVYLRRTKHEVRHDMPPKLRSTLTLDLPPQAAHEYRRLEREWLSLNMQGSHLAALSELRHRCAEWKVDALDEFITGLVNEGQKVVLFSSFHSPLDRIEAIWGQGVVRLDGTKTQKQRDAAVFEFMEGDAPIFALQTQAGGVGLNLNHPACSTVVFLDLPWTPADVLQCEDRIWRINNANSITSVRAVFAGTVEEHVLDLITRKEGVLAQVLEGRSSLDVTELETSVLDDLLALYRGKKV